MKKYRKDYQKYPITQKIWNDFRLICTDLHSPQKVLRKLMYTNYQTLSISIVYFESLFTLS